MNGEDMRRSRLALGLSELALGQALDVNDRTVRRWERDGQKIPLTVAILMRLALKSRSVRRELGIANAKADGADMRQKGRPPLPGRAAGG